MMGLTVSCLSSLVILLSLVTSAMKLRDTPSLMDIGVFPQPGGQDPIDIMTDIAEDRKFVTCILQDKNGNTIRGIRRNVAREGGEVMEEVFNKWLNGKGKLPVTWQTLTDCLEVAKLMSLVEAIKKEIEASSSLDSLDQKGSPQHCTVNLSTHPVKNKVTLFTATQNIGNWVGLCTYLGASNSIMDGLKYNTAQDIIKKHECLTDVFNNFRLDWERVVRVVANFPISNPREACTIAKEYIGMGERECQCIISKEQKDGSSSSESTPLNDDISSTPLNDSAESTPQNDDPSFSDSTPQKNNANASFTEPTPQKDGPSFLESADSGSSTESSPQKDSTSSSESTPLNDSVSSTEPTPQNGDTSFSDSTPQKDSASFSESTPQKDSASSSESTPQKDGASSSESISLNDSVSSRECTPQEFNDDTSFSDSTQSSYVPPIFRRIIIICLQMPFLAKVGLFAVAVTSIIAIYFIRDIIKWMILASTHVCVWVVLFLILVVFLVDVFCQFIKDVATDLTFYIRGIYVVKLSIRNSSDYTLKVQALKLSSGWSETGESCETISGRQSREFEVSNARGKKAVAGQVRIKIIHHDAEDVKHQFQSEIFLNFSFGPNVAPSFRLESSSSQDFEIKCTCKPPTKYYLRTLLCECVLSVKDLKAKSCTIL